MSKIDAEIKLLRKKKKKMAKVQRRKLYKRFRSSSLALELGADNYQDMKKLYIIGNGFDLLHGLPTSYREFYEFAKNTIDEMENYYLFDLHNIEPWHDFENALGDFSSEEFFDSYNEVNIYSEDFRPKDIYGLEDEITEQTDIHVATIRETFFKWVSQVDIRQAKPQMTFQKDSQFITFNYTSTLQSVYGIEDARVFHIHGGIKSNEDLIFGHGVKVVEPSEFDDGDDFMFSDAKRAAMYPIVALKKPVDEVLEKNKSYFDQLNDVVEIVIIGHSLNAIDQPYFRYIANIAINARWKVFCYTSQEKEEHVQTLINYGIKQNRIEVCTYADL